MGRCGLQLTPAGSVSVSYALLPMAGKTNWDSNTPTRSSFSVLIRRSTANCPTLPMLTAGWEHGRARRVHTRRLGVSVRHCSPSVSGGERGGDAAYHYECGLTPLRGDSVFTGAPELYHASPEPPCPAQSMCLDLVLRPSAPLFLWE